jgi:hypothetical protein
METINKRRLDTEPHQFNPDICIENTKQSTNADVFEMFGDRISLAEKFLSQELLPATQAGNVQLQSINDHFGEIKADFSVESSNHEAVIADFGKEIFEEAKKHSLDEELLEISMLEIHVDAFSVQQITTGVKSNLGPLVHQGWRIYPNSYDEAILVIYEPGKPYRPDFKVVNLTALHKENPDFVENKVRELYKAGLEDKLETSITYNLGVHNVDEAQIIPSYVSELTTCDKVELDNIQRLLTIISQNEEGDSSKILRLIQRLDQTDFKIPNDSRYVKLNAYLEHKALCTSESTEAVAKSRDEIRVINRLRATNPNRPAVQIVIEGQETFKNPIFHTPEFIDNAISIESEASHTDKDFVSLIAHTSKREKSLATTQKYLKRRTPKSYQHIEKFKVALGNSPLDRPNFDEFLKDAVSKFSIELGSKLANYGINSLEDAEKVIAQSLYAKTTMLTDVNKWVWKDDGRYQVNLRDTLLYLALKTVQQNSIHPSTRAGADQVVGWLKDKYVAKIENSKQKIAELDLRKKNSHRLMRNLNIPRQQMDKLVNHVKEEKTGIHQRYDHVKFGVLYKILIYSKQGLVDLDSKATKAVLNALYPSIKDEEWGLLKY